MIATVDGWIPLQHRETVRGLARDIDSAIAGFVRGQAVVCLILAAFYAIGLTLTGLNFGFLIGLMTGLLSFIPYVGALTGFLVAGDRRGRAVLAGLDARSLMVVGVFMVGQGLEGYVLSPKLVGAKVGLHPVWLMFALLAFGYLFGFVGLLIAVPLAATIGVLVRFALRKYHRKPDLHRRGAALSHGRAPTPSPQRAHSAPTQLALALDHAESFAREDFLAGPSNAAALALIERWPDWPSRTVLLRGPEGSGKSHLAAIWARAVRRADAVAARARRRRGADRARHRRAGAGESRRRPLRRGGAVSSAQSRARGARLCADHRAQRADDLADRGARSRLAAARAPVVALTAPDDALLRAVIVKLFADRQLAVDESLVSFLTTRIERSFAAARAAVAALDREALRLKRPVTRALAGELFREP